MCRLYSEPMLAPSSSAVLLGPLAVVARAAAAGKLRLKSALPATCGQVKAGAIRACVCSFLTRMAGKRSGERDPPALC